MGRELDGRDLGGELVRHRVELLAAGQHLQRLQQRQVRLVVSRDLRERLIVNTFNIFSIDNNLEVQVDVCSFEAEAAPRGAVQPHRAAGQVLLQQVVDLEEKILVEVENI